MAKKNDVKRIIEIGYGAPSYKGGVLWFRVGALPTNKADWNAMIDAMANIDYGEFLGAPTGAMLHNYSIALDLVEFGREYSPVLYLHFSRTKAPDLARGVKKEVDAFKTWIHSAYGINPDEFYYDERRRCLRLWWD